MSVRVGQMCRSNLCFRRRPWVQTQHGGIRISVGREPREIESIDGVTDALVERLELVALERPCLVHVAVERLDDDSVFLHVGDPEATLRE